MTQASSSSGAVSSSSFGSAKPEGDAFAFIVDGELIQCQRSVLLQKSPYLREYLRTIRCSKITIKNVPLDACKAVLGWMHSDCPIHEVVPDSPSFELSKLHKIWEISLRFTAEPLVRWCCALLEGRFTEANICSIISTTYRYANLMEPVNALNESFRKRCFVFLKNNYESIKKSSSFFAMSANATVKHDVDRLMSHANNTPYSSTPREPSDPRHTPARETKEKEIDTPAPSEARQRSGTAHLLQQLRGQPVQPTSITTPHANPPPPPPLHRTPVPVQEPPQVANHANQVPKMNVANQMQSEVRREPAPKPVSDLHEPVYEPTLVWQKPYAQREDAVHTPQKAAKDAEGPNTLSPVPQPPVRGAASVENEAVFLSVDTTASCMVGGRLVLPEGVRLATCVEAHTQRKNLRDLMDSIDGGFLASFLLEDGKVEGPGFGVPLRFSTGKQFASQCEMLVLASQDDRQVSTAKLLKQLVPQDALGADYNTERSSLMLKQYILQQEVRVLTHEMELFKNDFLDWESSLEESNALRSVEEERLKQRIIQQKRQLIASLYKEAMHKERTQHLQIDGDLKHALQSAYSSVDDTNTTLASEDEPPSFMQQPEEKTLNELTDKIQAEKQSLLRAKANLQRKAESEELRELNEEMQTLQASIAKSNHVKDLITTELSENEQYSEYSKRYVTSVATADEEISALLTSTHSLGDVRDVLRGITLDKGEHELEAVELHAATKSLTSRISSEALQIKHICEFLEESDHQVLPSALL